MVMGIDMLSFLEVQTRGSQELKTFPEICGSVLLLFFLTRLWPRSTKGLRV